MKELFNVQINISNTFEYIWLYLKNKTTLLLAYQNIKYF